MGLKMEYRWKNTFYNNSAEASKVKKEIDSIGECVSPEELVDFAQKNKKSEMYKCFTWDNSIAGHKYRLYEARQMVSSIIIVSEEKEKEEITYVVQCREYENVKDKTGKQGYMKIHTILTQEDLYIQLIHSMTKTIFEMKEKIKTYRSLKDDADKIFGHLEKIESIIRKAV